MDRDSIQAGDAVSAAPAGSGAPPPATVLVVDDCQEVRLVLAARLSAFGYRVVEAEDGEQALELLRQERPDVTILDWEMPSLGGLDVCKRVRQDPELKSSHIILLTAHDQAENIVEGLKSGANDFLSKQARSEEILARVQGGIRAAALMREIVRAHDALRAEKEHLEAELQSAAQVMKSLLPAPGEPAPGLRLTWRYKPSLALGGDLFGVTRWDQDHLGLFMLDASGHGVAAALRAASMIPFLHPANLQQVVGSYYPSAILAEANRRFPITGQGDYFTLWVGVLHLPTWVLRFASAGHAGAILCGPNRTSVGLSANDLALGLDPSSIYKSGQQQMKPGDRLYLCSDGIYETLSPDQEVWGLERLQQVVERDVACPADEVLDRCFAVSRMWQRAETFSDDAALLCLERLAL